MVRTLSDLATRFSRAERAGIIRILRSKPDVSLSDIRLLFGRGRFGRILGTLTMREFFMGAPDETIDPITGTPDKLARRQRYDDQILGALRDSDEPLSEDEVVDVVGGSRQDARVALARLARDRRVRRTLSRRGTKYVLAD